MAHLKRVARTGFPLSDGHAVPGTLADHACTWTENPRPKRRTRSLPHTGTAVPAVPLACNGASAKLKLASGHNFLVSNSTERSSRPSPRAAPPRGVHKDAHQPIKSKSWPARSRGDTPRLQRKPPRRQATGGAESASRPHSQAPSGWSDQPRAGRGADARRAIYTRQPRHLLAPVSVLIFLGGCWPAGLEREPGSSGLREA